MKNNDKKPAIETVVTHSGRHPDKQFGYVNTPVYRGSTILFPTLDDLESTSPRYDYGRTGNPSASAVEDLVTELEGAVGTVLCPSGLSAVSLALLTSVARGGHVLVTDATYQPTRRFASETLDSLGIEIEFYDSRIGAGIERLLRPNTQAIYVESPSSLTFEVQDLPAIAAAARGRGIKIIADNTWATPLFYRPLQLGADIVLHSGTKMFVGHSDAMFGTVSANPETWKALKRTHLNLGLCASPDDCFLAARGLRTLAIRMREHSQRSTALARWLEGQNGVVRVLHPALESHPDHAVFVRDFSGAGSVFSVELEPRPRAALAAAVDGFKLFGMGWSWGGYESLCLPVHPEKIRTATGWTSKGHLLRIHTGLEDLEELKADLSAALARYAAS
ncbi:MAG TPA: cystathionine beta-lyase [Devosia sp.]|nr:cystathionine beta-lyase [Devosia sp.]